MACSACLKALHPGGKWHGDAFPLNLLRYGALHTYILQVIAARFSDGLGMQYRSRYEAWCGQLAALEFMLLQYFHMDYEILPNDSNISRAGKTWRTTSLVAAMWSRFIFSMASV